MYKYTDYSLSEGHQTAPYNRETPDPDIPDSLLQRQDAEARGDMYRFLASVYLQPLSLELVQHISDEAFLEELAVLFGDGVVAELKAFGTAANPEDEIPLLRQEYMDLFAVPLGRYVTPFEDVYRGIRQDGSQERGPLLGERAVAAKILYREAGARVDKACNELPTHVGVELAFMAFLCKNEAAAIERMEKKEKSGEKHEAADEAGIYRQYQLKFLDEHLNAWFPQLSRAIQDKSRSGFYRGLARLTETFLAMDLGAIARQDAGTVSVAAVQPGRGRDN